MFNDTVTSSVLGVIDVEEVTLEILNAVDEVGGGECKHLPQQERSQNGGEGAGVGTEVAPPVVTGNSTWGGAEVGGEG